MDCLNTKLQQKELGAFFTPERYAKISQDMLLRYIEDIKAKGKDYIIIDRACGTGGLFNGLPDEVLSHCVLSTLEPNEYIILREQFGGKALVVVPPMDALKYDIIPAETDNKGNVINDIIREKVEDKNVVVIMYENPPYSDTSANNVEGNTARDSVKDKYVFKEMNKALSRFNCKNVSTCRDLSNLFIWSAFEYYLKGEDDIYILYSPIKYWKSLHIVNKEFIEGYIVNRKHFHATAGAVALIAWRNKEADLQSIVCKVIEDDGSRFDVKINRVYKTVSNGYDRRVFDDDKPSTVMSEANGLQSKRDVEYGRCIDSDNVIGYMFAQGFDIDIKSIHLVRNMFFNGRGFYLHKDNYKSKLPLFVASIPSDELSVWYYKGLLNKTLDGGNTFEKDEDFIKKCFIYTCLSFNNKCRSLYGSNGKFYRNELCFDKNTLASKDLKQYALNERERDLINRYYDILKEIKDKKEYNKDFSYGPYQIREEINTKREEKYLNSKGYEVTKLILNYKELNSMLLQLRDLLKIYYREEILPSLFKYELIK